MATQTGSIDLTSTNAVKLYAEAGFENAEQTYATKGELEVTNEAVALRATKEEAYQVARPNLAPLTAAPLDSVYNATTNPNGYWKTALSPWYTQLEDGWVHVYKDNSEGTEAANTTTFRPRPCPSIVPGETYTILIEVRNNHSTGSGNTDMYIQQTAKNQFWGSGGGNIQPLTFGEETVIHSQKVADTAHLSGDPMELFRYNACCAAGSVLDFEFRLSLYEGIYDGPYKPYAGQQLFATQAELKVTADGVSSKVSKDDYNGATIVSYINQSADTVRIEAEHVEVTGAAVFSAINGDTGSTKIDGGKVDVTSITVGDLSDGDDYATKTEAQGYADDIQVGGRNLLRDTAFSHPMGTYWVAQGLSATVTNDTLVIDSSAASGNERIYASPFVHDVSETYAFSCDVVASTACQVSFGRRYKGVNNYGLTFDVSTSKQRVSGVYNATVTGAFCIGLITNGATVTVSNIKLERGNKPTDWTPAPEDEVIARKAVYGTCSTAYNVAAKVVACKGFELVTGARITIKFTNVNTTAAPTLNVNGTGAAPVWNNNAVASATNPVYWAANATLSFVYDGAHWILDEKPAVYSVACSTAAGTRAKEAAVAGALVVNGTTVQVLFSTANTYVANSVQFKFSGTAAANIYRDRAATSASHTLTWEANTVLTLVRNAQYWYLADNGTRTMSEEAAKTATNYISADSSGIRIASSNPATATTYQHQTATETEFVVDGASMAEFGGSGARIGEVSEGKYHLRTESNGVTVKVGSQVVGTMLADDSGATGRQFVIVPGENVGNTYYMTNLSLESNVLDGTHYDEDTGEKEDYRYELSSAGLIAYAQSPDDELVNRHAMVRASAAVGGYEDYNTVEIMADRLWLSDNISENEQFSMYEVVRALSYQSYDFVSRESGAANYHLVVAAGICHCYFQGGNNTRGTGHQLFTLPEACLPTSEKHIPFVVNSGAYGHAVINPTSGLCSVSQISASVSGRIYINASWPVV